MFFSVAFSLQQVSPTFQYLRLESDDDLTSFNITKSYTVRVPGNKHRFVHADSLRYDDSERNKKEDKEVCE